MLKGDAPRMGALYRNEWTKLWARRGRALVIFFLVIVGAGSFLAYHADQQNQYNYQANLNAMRSQLASQKQALSKAPAAQKPALHQQIQQMTRAIKSMAAQGSSGVTNEKRRIQSTQHALKSAPASSKGLLEEQLAQSRYAVAHGILHYHTLANSGFRFTGQVFSGMGVDLFALVALMLSADVIASETERGTWGILLLHAPIRGRVYVSKVLASITMMTGFMAASACGLWGLGSLLMGAGHADAPEAVGVIMKQFPHLAMIQPISQVFHIIPQWQYDGLALLLSSMGMGALMLLVIALSAWLRSTVFTLVIGALMVLSVIFVHFLPGIAPYDLAVNFALMADWTGQNAMQYGTPHLTLGLGGAVTMGWALLSTAVGFYATRALDV